MGFINHRVERSADRRGVGAPIGNEANEIEQIDAGLFENEDERMIVYDEGEWEAIRREIVKIPTKDFSD